MFNAGLFGSDVDYGEECEIIDKKRCRATSRQSEQNAAGQGTWKCGLPAEFIDGDQMTLKN